jgi:hypothetical protein
MAAKKDNTPSKPIVSRVPLPVSDSALVIDLPDGQKLVIGKMSQGTVIEVATWRGVGRPDSRTNRMMFGMSTAEIEDESEGAGASSKVSLQPENLVTKIINYPIALVRWLFNIQSVPTVKRNGKKRNKMIIEPSVSENSGASTSSEPSRVTTKSRGLTNVVTVLSRAFVGIKKLILPQLKKLLKIKGMKKLNSHQAKPLDTGQDLEFESWLASITEKSNKKLNPPKSVNVVKKGSKK